ncbi:hypothetical protein BDN67DRAFT_1016514 [Paxillus ammoniavirescens]|nr:hypothetical protein BDN67DRAFT_1016514 [Paxillus ammoniavirescens]
MARVELEDETVEIPELRADGHNWSAYHKRLKRALNRLRMAAYLNEMTPNPYDSQTNTYIKCAIASTIPDSLFLRICHCQSAHECFETLKNLFEKDTATMELLRQIWSDTSKQEAAYSPHRPNDCVRTRKVGDTSHRDGGVSNRSGRRNDVPRNNTRRQHERQTRSQGRVDRGRCQKPIQSRRVQSEPEGSGNRVSGMGGPECV